jgi:hypothetical protein
MKDALKSSDTTLVLAHLIDKDNDYTKACIDFKKAGGKIIMDNSFYELRENMPLNVLAEKAKLINADVLVLPDLPLRDNFRFMASHSIKKLKEFGYTGKFMMCVFAKNADMKEDMKQFKILNEIPGLDIIAIPYSFREEDEFKRPHFLDLIEEKVGVQNITKQIHLFGCNSIKNLYDERRSWVQSIDGSMPWKCGYYKLTMPVETYDEPRRPKNYFAIGDITKDQRSYIDFNLKFVKRVCEEKDAKVI